MRRTLPLLLVLVLGGLAFFLLTRDDRRRELPGPEAPEGLESPASSSTERGASGAGSGDEGGTGEPERTALAADDPGAPGPGSRAIEPAPEDGVEIRVVQRDGGAPVAGAEVAFLDAEAMADPEVMEIRTGALSMDELLERVGRRFLADETGRVRVPRPRGGAVVAGSSGDLWGMLQFTEAESAELVLELAPDPSLFVRVVDEAGRPLARVPVAFRQRSGRQVADLFLEETDDTGLATFRHALRFLEDMLPEGSPARLFVGASVLLEDPVEREIDLREFPREPVELVLPPTGSLVVSLWNPDGTPVDTPALVRTIRAEGEVVSTSDFSRSAHVDRLAREGTATFHHVGVGLDLFVRVESAAGHAPLTRREAGPSEAGEQVRLELVLADMGPVLVGRAVDPGDAPLSGQPLQARLGHEGSGDMRQVVRTDPTGGFRIPVPADWPDGAETWLELDARGPAGAELGTRLELQVRPGENDLGDVAFLPRPLVASGVVRDEAGAPVPGAQVLVETNQAAAGDGRVTAWRALWEHRATTNSQGRFEIRAFLEVDRVRLTAKHAEHIDSEGVEVAVGSSDLVLVLRSAGRLQGKLLLPDGLGPELFQVRAVSGGSGHMPHSQAVERDGSFEITGLPARTYAVGAQLEGEPECVVFVKNVRVGPDVEAQPIELDLRDRVHAFSLRIVDAEGKPVQRGTLRRRPAGAQEWLPYETTVSAGAARIVTCEATIDVEVDVPGHRIETLLGVTENRFVYLLPGPRVRIVLSGGLPELDPDASLGIHLQGQYGERWSFQGSTQFDAEGIAELTVQDAGTYLVFVRVSRDGGPAATVSPGAEETIEVEELEDAQTFELVLSQETLRAIADAR